MKKQIKGTLTIQNLTEQIKGTLKHLKFWPDLELNGGVINSNTVVICLLLENIDIDNSVLIRQIHSEEVETNFVSGNRVEVLHVFTDWSVHEVDQLPWIAPRRFIFCFAPPPSRMRRRLWKIVFSPMQSNFSRLIQKPFRIPRRIAQSRSKSD